MDLLLETCAHVVPTRLPEYSETTAAPSVVWFSLGPSRLVNPNLNGKISRLARSCLASLDLARAPYMF